MSVRITLFGFEGRLSYFEGFGSLSCIDFVRAYEKHGKLNDESVTCHFSIYHKYHIDIVFLHSLQ